MLRCVDAVKMIRALEQTRRSILPRIAPVHWYLLISPWELQRRAARGEGVDKFRSGAARTTLSRFLEELTKEVAP